VNESIKTNFSWKITLFKNRQKTKTISVTLNYIKGVVHFKKKTFADNLLTPVSSKMSMSFFLQSFHFISIIYCHVNKLIGICLGTTLIHKWPRRQTSKIHLQCTSTVPNKSKTIDQNLQSIQGYERKSKSKRNEGFWWKHSRIFSI